VIVVVVVGIVTVATQTVKDAKERRAAKDRYSKNQSDFNQVEVIFQNHPTERQILGIMGSPDWAVTETGADDVAIAGPLGKGEKDFWWGTGDSGLAKGVRLDNTDKAIYIFSKY